MWNPIIVSMIVGLQYLLAGSRRHLLLLPSRKDLTDLARKENLAMM